MFALSVASLDNGGIFARRYRIVRLIAAGGMGAVHEVVHLETDRRLALKVMHPHVLASQDLRERFKREAKISGRLASEHIVDVFDAGIDEPTGMPFLVMELLQGEDLGERLRRFVRLPPAEVVTHLAQTARALDKAHRAHIVHRDVKPRNLFLARREDGPPRIKVLDFGIAKVVAEGAWYGTTQVLGTPLYMAPEQLDADARLTAAADIYALGMVAYTLLVGVPYFDGEATDRGLLALAAVIARGPREPASARARARSTALPGAFDAWFARATAVRPECRFATAIETVRALAEALEVGEGAPLLGPPARARSPSPSAPPTPSTIAPPRLSSLTRALAAGVAGLGLAFGLWRAFGIGPGRPACEATEAACGLQCADTSADPENCGVCGHGCLGGACEMGACQPIVLARAQDRPTDLVTHEGRVYWINSGSGDQCGAVRSIGVDGGPITTLASGQDEPSGMATDGVHVYWVNYGDGTVNRVPLAGGEPEVLARGQGGPRSVAVGNLGIYWTTRDDGTITFRSTAGEVKVLASGQDQPGDLALSAEHLYWAARGGQDLMTMSIPGGGPRILAHGPEIPIGIAVDAEHVYWIEYEKGRVMSVPLRGGAPSMLASGQGHPLAIAVDASRVYWTSKDEGTVMARSLDGGHTTRLYCGLGWPESLALDARNIYWTNTGDGTVMRLAK
jgi:eukaryotic-like serine/threonine-protein kinase